MPYAFLRQISIYLDTAKLLPSSCRRCCQAAHNCRTAAAAAVLPLPPPRLRCRQAAAATAKLLAAAAKLPAVAELPPWLRCRQAAATQAVVRLMKHSKIRLFLFHDENPTNLKGRVVSHLFTGKLAGKGKLPALAGWYSVRV
jgi:hypothetical protein